MPIDKFRFVSPGVQVAEIDQSLRRRDPVDPGPLVIGRFERGPTMRPVKVDSLAHLTEVFGDMISGRGSADISRNGNYSAPSYAAYAAYAWLKNQGGITVVRLVGKEDDNRVATTGEAGWSNSTEDDTGRGGAWGLWLMPSASNIHSTSTQVTGTLGAIIYTEADTVVALSGTLAGGTDVGQGSTHLFESSGAGAEFKLTIRHDPANASSSIAGTADDTVTINFAPSSNQFIRKALNTTPHNTNTAVVGASTNEARNYWLGETFENAVNKMLKDASMDAAADGCFAFVAPMVKSGTHYHDHTMEAQAAKSGWVFANDTSSDAANYAATNMQKLFRVVSLEESDWTARNMKISIRNIRLPNRVSGQTYGKFDLIVRKLSDNDGAIEYVETFTGLDLNPASPMYVARQVGDQYAVWNDDEKRYRYFGTFPNRSKYIRMEMATAVDEGGVSAELVPFGYYGMPRPSTITWKATAVTAGTANAWILGNETAAACADGGDCIRGSVAIRHKHTATSTYYTASLAWPTHTVVATASAGYLSDHTDRYWGFDATEGSTAQGATQVFSEDNKDLAKVYGGGMSAGSWDAGSGMEVSYYFTLDDVVGPSATKSATWYSGARAAAASITAVSGSGAGASSLIDAGYDRFTMPLYGGFDGLEIKEMEPLINNRLLAANGTVTGSYEYYTVRRAIDTVSDPEVVDMNALLVPGVTNSGITDHMINTCEVRADALAIVDIPYAYTARQESADGNTTRNGVAGGNTVTAAVNDVKSRGLNSSYGCTYYPWVQAIDPMSGMPVWVPPSVVALGAMSYGQATQALWFAPAGFTRGGLSDGRGGLQVVSVSQRLSSKERDKLYEVGVNPIAHFPAEGIVIFGQKTLQALPSALDRINVRRLLIFIKKRISQIAATLLFEPNVVATWGKFTSKVRPFLDGIKTGYGLEDFKVVLDSTTTTADLIDRNTLYAQIYVKPTKAIEFIAIDFIITSQGASFDD